MNPTLAAIAHSKFRNAIGLVGIEIDSKQNKIRVRLAKQWSRDKLNIIPDEIGELYKKIKWGNTYIDQQTGQHLIQSLKQKEERPLRIIHTQKNLKDADEIERIKIMDKIEMAQFMLELRQNHVIEFPEKPSKDMTELEEQVALYMEHKTEAGTIDYYAPGEELDSLIKGLLIACFAARKILSGNDGIPVMGPVRGKYKPRNARGADYQRDTDIVSELGRGPKGRLLHYF